MRHYADIGPGRGAVRYCIAGDTAGVHSSPESRSIGVATCVGRDGRGRSLWQITVDEAELPGRWVIIGREFRPAK